MAVIINELEVILEAPPAPAGAPVTPAAATPVLRPSDIGDILARRERERLRLYAH
jgi:hypothetical protein